MDHAERLEKIRELGKARESKKGAMGMIDETMIELARNGMLSSYIAFAMQREFRKGVVLGMIVGGVLGLVIFALLT